MPKGHPGQASQGHFGCCPPALARLGQVLLWPGVLAPEPQRAGRGGTAAIIPLYSYEYCTAFLGLGSDTETRERVKTSRRFITKGRTIQ